MEGSWCWAKACPAAAIPPSAVVGDGVFADESSGFAEKIGLPPAPGGGVRALGTAQFGTNGRGTAQIGSWGNSFEICGQEQKVRYTHR